MTQHVERPGVLLGQHAECPARAERRHEILHLAIQLDRDGRLQQARPDRANDITRKRSWRNFAHGTIGKGEPERRFGRGSVDHDVRGLGLGRVTQPRRGRGRVAGYVLTSGEMVRPKRTYNQMPSTRTIAIAPQIIRRDSGTGSSGGCSCELGMDLEGLSRILGDISITDARGG